MLEYLRCSCSCELLPFFQALAVGGTKNVCLHLSFSYGGREQNKLEKYYTVPLLVLLLNSAKI